MSELGPPQLTISSPGYNATSAGAASRRQAPPFLPDVTKFRRHNIRNIAATIENYINSHDFLSCWCAKIHQNQQRGRGAHLSTREVQGRPWILDIHQNLTYHPQN